MKKLILLVVFVLTLLAGCSKEKIQPEPTPNPPVTPEQPSQYDVTATVKTPGTLSSLIPSSSFKTIKIDGKLNGSDVRYLRGIIPSLTKIDISDASIVSGGDSYFNITHKTEDNVIGQYMFSQLSGGFEIVLPKSVTEIKPKAFTDSPGLLSVELPSVTYIGDDTFYNCTNLKEITIPQSVQSIGNQVFSGCTSLKKVTIGSNVNTIGWSSFKDCSSLSEITLPEKLKVISSNLLDGTSIGEIIIPSATEAISTAAFQQCSKLKKVIIGKSVKEIHPWAFNLSSNINTVEIDKNNPYLAAESGIIYSKDFKEIVLNIFSKTIELAIKDGVEKIKEQAFGKVSPEKLILPASVTTIEHSAFSKSVKEVHCKGVNPPRISWTVTVGSGYYGLYAFRQAVETHAILFVPSGAKDNYTAATGYRVCFEMISEE